MKKMIAGSKKREEKENGMTGSLQDFGLTDLLQMLGQQQKTGVLHLSSGDKEVQIFFDQGMIVGTASRQKNGPESPLGERLIRGGLLPREKWQGALKQHQEEMIPVEKVLLQTGLVRREDLTATLRLLVFETVYNLFKWKGGRFHFVAKPVSFDPGLLEPLQPEYLLLDVLRMVDEWPLFAERIPTFQMVLRKVDPLGALDGLGGKEWEKKRTFQMDVIYELINGQRTIQEIIDLSFVGEFDSCKSIIVLLDSGVIEVSGTLEGGRKEKRGGVRKIMVHAGPGLLLAALILLAFWQIIFVRGEFFPLTRPAHDGWLTFRDSLRKIEEQKAIHAREVYFLEKGRSAASLSPSLPQ
jgi:hypothetical protein